MATLRSSRPRLLALPIALAIGLLSAAPTAVDAAQKTPWDTNLLVNPGAEAGAASSDGYAVVPIPGWYTTIGFTVVKYGQAGGFPTKKHARKIGGGEKFFSAGVHSTSSGGGCGSAYQDRTIVGRDAAIDAGRVTAVLTARAGTFQNQSDTAVVVLWVGSNQFQVTRTSTYQKLQNVSISISIPAGERFLAVTLYAENVPFPDYCDAYFDRVSLKIVKT